MRIFGLIWISMALCAPIWGQTDAEKFAEGRVAFDTHHDCPAANDALAGVSQAGRSNPLWIFYMAKVQECMNHADEALKYYEQYDRLVPGQPEVLNKIGELRYQFNRQQREKEAERARQQKLEQDRLARERRKETAQRMLPEYLRALQLESLLNSSWTVESGTTFSIAVTGKQSCEFQLVTAVKQPDEHLDVQSKWQSVIESSNTLTMSLYLDRIGPVSVSRDQRDSSPSLKFSPDQFQSEIVDGSFREISRRVPKRADGPQWDNSRSGAMNGKHTYSLNLPPSASDADIASLKQAFERTVQACHDAQ